MRRLSLALLLLLAVSCSTTSNVRTPANTASTPDFDVRVVRAMIPETFRSDNSTDARVILAVTNNTDQTYELARILVKATGGHYYLPLHTHQAKRTLEAGETEAFNVKVTAFTPVRPSRDPFVVQTTIEAHAAGSEAVREESFSQHVRLYVANARVAHSMNGFNWNYDASVHIPANDYPPQGIWRDPMDGRQ